VRALYWRPPSFTDLLPWVEYLPDEQVFLLEDGRSTGALLEIEPAGCEARPPAFLQEIRNRVQAALAGALPETAPDPWILQVYVQDEPSLATFARRLDGYARPEARDSGISAAFLALMREHLRDVGRPGGLFEDTLVTGTPWRGRLRRVRAVLYRRRSLPEPVSGGIVAAAEVRETTGRLATALEAAGLRARLCGGRDLYEWLLPWLNPAPAIAEDGDALLEAVPYPGDAELPFGYDLAESLTLSPPESDLTTGCWRFDGLYHRALSVQALRSLPLPGHFTAERTSGDRIFALFDKLPEHTILCFTLIARPQERLRDHVARVRRASVGDGAEAVLARENAAAVERRMARGDRLYPLAITLLVRGRDPVDLNRNLDRSAALPAANGLQPIARESDLLALDSYLRAIPMAYDAALDKKSRRTRLTFASHCAALLPFYGRARGTGNPCLTFFNRGGGPLGFDPLNPEDRKKNGHMLILGPTGAGKSALLTYLVLSVLAMHRPRLYIIEAGNSFGLLCRWLAAHGLAVHDVTMSPGADVSLPPFGGALAMLAQEDDPSFLSEDALDEESPEGEEDPALAAGRDRLGEMEIAARIMITGGDPRESARLTRADRLLIRRGILEAARAVRDRSGAQVLTQDVVAALRAIGAERDLPELRRERAAEMADGMALFCSGLAGRLFNRPGQHWPDADVTRLEMGLLAREGYEDQLTVAYTAMMNHINGVVEARQNERRPTLVVTDEGHIITTNPLLAPYVVKITKMWRKYGAWYWIATQNLEDFPDASRRMLNMIEWWLCLVMPKEEVDAIARFRALSEEQRGLLRSARKEPGKYTEGVVLSDGFEALFRNVPPALALALAQTEKEEKAYRAEVMRLHGCSESAPGSAAPSRSPPRPATTTRTWWSRPTTTSVATPGWTMPARWWPPWARPSPRPSWHPSAGTGGTAVPMRKGARGPRARAAGPAWTTCSATPTPSATPSWWCWPPPWPQRGAPRPRVSAPTSTSPCSVPVRPRPPCPT
jgi:conjugative transfer ATPase